MIKKIVLGLVILGSLGAAGWFIYEKYFNEFSSFQKDVIEIVLADSAYSYNPYTYTEANDQLLRNIYEPLVKTNQDLKIIPAISNSYGQISDNVWEFKLNPQVKFHNGDPVTSEIIKFNFDRFKNLKVLDSLVSSIKDFRIVDDLTFQIETKYPDSSLLYKLTLLNIAPKIELAELEINPIGTGPYLPYKIKDNRLMLIENTNYYGVKPKFPKIQFTTIKDQFERLSYSIKSDRVIMIYPMASEFASKLSASKFDLKEFPTTSANFFIFNRNRNTFQSAFIRQFFTRAIDEKTLITLTNGLGMPISQFVSDGVFGFNEEVELDRLEAEELLQEVKRRNLVGFQFKVAMPEGLEVFANLLKNKFRNVGLLADITLVPQSKIYSQEIISNYDLIFTGWKSDYGDSIAFLDIMVKRGAGLNYFNYNNTTVNKLIDESKSTLDQAERLNKLKQINKIIVKDDPFGIPLFESKTIYAVAKNYKYTPRLDGFIDVYNLELEQIYNDSI